MVIENIPPGFFEERATTIIDNGFAVFMGAAGAWMYGYILKN